MNRYISGIALASFVALSGCTDHAPGPKAELRKWPREEFTRLVMGKPDNVVLSKFGEPFLNNNYAGQFGILWTYRNITFDPVSGRADQFATVVFEHGVVAKVMFK